MRGPDLQPLAAGVAALLLVGSVAWWLLSTPELADPGQPTWKGADIVRLKADVPQIAKFDQFYINHENPFVPFHLRGPEITQYDPVRRNKPVKPPAPAPIPPPKQAVVVVEPKLPVLELPKLTRPSSNVPVVYGLLMSDGHEVVIVRMPDSNTPKNLKPGEKIDDWTLISIDSGNLATFLDPQGLEQRFAIGQGNLAAQESGGAGTDAPNDKGGARGPQPKMPGPGGPVPKAGGAQGADGPIPRPPPREERRRREQPADDKGRNIPQPPPKK